MLGMARARPNRTQRISQANRQVAAVGLYQHLESDIESRLYHGHRDEAYRRSGKVAACRKTQWFTRHKETGLVRLAYESCKQRWCPLCGSAKVSWITFTVSEWLANRNQPKFATFTIKHNEADLDEQLTSLTRNFYNLRRRPEFRKRVRGGIWFFQIKKSAADNLWHNHYHSVIDSDYFPQAELSQMWERVTHDSRIVDIRIIREPGKVANEVARYAACPCDLSKNTLQDNVTIYEALHGKRICGSWGTAKGVTLKPPKDDHPELWENIGSRLVVCGLCHSDPNARAILDAYENQTVLEEGVTVATIEDFLDDNLSHYLNLRN